MLYKRKFSNNSVRDTFRCTEKVQVTVDVSGNEIILMSLYHTVTLTLVTLECEKKYHFFLAKLLCLILNACSV